MNKENMAVLTNIIGAVESGGQVYGRRDYAAYAAPYTNSSLEHTITLGWAQNYGSEARTLIQMIYDADTTAFKKLDTAGIAAMLNKDWVALKWNPTAAQKKVLIALIDSEAGHTCQDALFAQLMETFIVACEQTYTTDIKAVMMYCEIRHLGGKSAADRIFGRLGGDYSLDAIMASLARDQQDTSSDNQVGDAKFWSRHVKCYQFISQYAVTETAAEVPEKEELMAAEIIPAKVIAVAEAEEGYLEKKSNSQLDDKTANAGSNNYTKYGRDLLKWIPEAGDTYGIDYQWCDQFVDWCFVVAFGKEVAKKLLGGWSAYTPVSADYFKKRGLWYTKPQVGDVVFFRNSTRICHTGIVWKVSGNTVYTIEGNTSGASGVVANGGGVKKKSYTIGDSYIAGYGRPPYDTTTASTDTSATTPTAANTTTNTTTTTSNKEVFMFAVEEVYLGCRCASVLLLQRLLRVLGYKGKTRVLKLDGDAGENTIYALKAYQYDMGLKVDGDAGPATWGKLLSGLSK